MTRSQAEELIRKAAIKLVIATPPCRRTGSRIPNDTIDENSTESIIEVVNEVVDGN